MIHEVTPDELLELSILRSPSELQTLEQSRDRTIGGFPFLTHVSLLNLTRGLAQTPQGQHYTLTYWTRSTKKEDLVGLGEDGPPSSLG
jgi:hypothetical protein